MAEDFVRDLVTSHDIYEGLTQPLPDQLPQKPRESLPQPGDSPPLPGRRKLRRALHREFRRNHSV